MQIEDWLKQAESVKALIACINMNQMPTADVEHKGKKRLFSRLSKKIKLLTFLQKTD